jgi:hypothetical protein
MKLRRRSWGEKGRTLVSLLILSRMLADALVGHAPAMDGTAAVDGKEEEASVCTSLDQPGIEGGLRIVR